MSGAFPFVFAEYGLGIEEFVRAMIAAHAVGLLAIVVSLVPRTRRAARWISLGCGVATTVLMAPYIADVIRYFSWDTVDAPVRVLSVTPTLMSVAAIWIAWRVVRTKSQGQA